jgi:hypothetical protein
MSVVFDEIVGTVDGQTPPERQETAAQPAAARPPDEAQLRAVARRTMQREERLRAD